MVLQSEKARHGTTIRKAETWYYNKKRRDMILQSEQVRHGTTIRTGETWYYNQNR